MELVTVEQAVELIIDRIQPITKVERVPLMSALGRVLADTMYAPMSNPPFDRSPIDGYALKASDTKGAKKETPIMLTVVGEVDAGHASSRVIQSGEAMRIMTGAPIPEGCDCCIRQESTDYGEEIVTIYEEMNVHDNYCDLGEDIREGSLLLHRFTKLTFVELGILASMGIDTVPVLVRPRIALITTGDEVTPPGEKLEPGKIYNSNQTMLEARMQELGIPFSVVAKVSDDPEELANLIRELASKVDAIITTGGVSVGKKDILHETIKILKAQRVFWKVLLKPGTPTIFSIYNNLPIISLSGNPFGALANTELLIRPMLDKMIPHSQLCPVRKKAIMEDEFLKESKGRRFIRGYYEDGKVKLPSMKRHSSGILSSMIGCNCMIDICPGTKALHKGDEVTVVLL